MTPAARQFGASPPGRVTFLALGCAVGFAACVASAPQSDERAREAPAPHAAPARRAVGIIPPNASRITATVVQRSVWPPGSLSGVRPAVRPDRTHASLTLEILSAAPVDPAVGSQARPGMVIEAFSPEPLAADLVGTVITAVVELTGTTLGTRWLISGIDPSR